MSLTDRSIGIAGLILACGGIAITILWPTARWMGWSALALAIIGICWAVLESRRAEGSASFVFVFGAPLGDNDSPVWIMMLKHYGPNSAYNCDINFIDADRKNIEHQWLLQHPGSGFPPPGLVGKSQLRLSVSEATPEAGPLGSIGSFQWSPLDPDRQHYRVSINCRDGVFLENWEIARVDGVLRTRIKVEHGPLWTERHPKLDPTVFACSDPEFIETPLASAVPATKPRQFNPGWKPNHAFEVPVAIVDPNGYVQVMSGVKLPDGSISTDFGCWNLLTKHFGNAKQRGSFRRLFDTALDKSLRALAVPLRKTITKPRT